ncbi:hypothetical protein MBLNU459_g0421t1 [Dothideomycetes sp. NU459]
MAHKATSPQVLEVITISDITSQILANAQALYTREQDLKVVTAQAPSGLIHYCSIIANEKPDPNYPNIPPRVKVVLQGDGATNRRTAMMTLLEQTEKRVAKEILKR